MDRIEITRVQNGFVVTENNPNLPDRWKQYVAEDDITLQKIVRDWANGVLEDDE